MVKAESGETPVGRVTVSGCGDSGGGARGRRIVKREPRPGSLSHSIFPAVRTNDSLCNRQTQSTALRFAGWRGSEKSLVYSWKVFFGDSDTLILEADTNIILLRESDFDFRTRRRILDCIVEEDQKELA